MCVCLPLGLIQFTEAEERDFIKLDLGPELAASHPSVKIMMGDDQRPALPTFAQTVLSDPIANSYVSGIAYHWYGETEDLFNDWDKLDTTHQAWPDKFMLPTEACEGFLPWDEGPELGNWNRAMIYAHDILNDLQHWASGWVDWNILLDMGGGPNHAKNWVDAPFICDTQNTTICYKQPMYYALGHFSKFIPRGSVRVDLNSTSTDPIEPALEVTAFQTPIGNDQQIVVVVLNRDPLFGRSFSVYDSKRHQYLNAEIEPSAIRTFIYAA